MSALDLPCVVSADGHHLVLKDGTRIFDACGGAAVACIGYGNKAVVKAVSEQVAKVAYVPWGFYDNAMARQLRDWLLGTTNGHMKDCFIMSSGSEAVEAAAKLAREYHVWNGDSKRVRFIARETSYHGCTLGALSLSGYKDRRAPYEAILPDHTDRLKAFNPYRQMAPGQDPAKFVAEKIAEVDAIFHQAGPHTVAAVIVEPVVGAAMGCVPALPGYLAALRALCTKYGALLIFDEVMCGMGRTGTLHAWQNPAINPTPVVPDLQTVGKGLSGGYAPASGLLIGDKVARKMKGRVFTHGHTYQDHPVVCAASLAVHKEIERNSWLNNVRTVGPLLGKHLKTKLGNHPHVGDIRGLGMFWGIELVKDKKSKKPFDTAAHTSSKIQQLAISKPYNLMIYYGQGCAGPLGGDQLMICPAYDITEADAKYIAKTLADVFKAFFSK